MTVLDSGTAAAVAKLRRTAERSRGQGMRVSVSVADLERLVRAVDAATAAVEPPKKSTGRVKTLEGQVAARDELVRLLASTVEAQGRYEAVDALVLWAEGAGVDVSGPGDLLVEVLAGRS